MNHSNSTSFPGFRFLLVLLTYLYVPYGYYLLTVLLIIFVLSGAARLGFRVLRRLSQARLQRLPGE